MLITGETITTASYITGVGAGMRGHMGNSVLSTQFFCKPKTAPKKSIKKNKKKKIKHISIYY